MFSFSSYREIDILKAKSWNKRYRLLFRMHDFSILWVCKQRDCIEHIISNPLKRKTQDQFKLRFASYPESGDEKSFTNLKYYLMWWICGNSNCYFTNRRVATFIWNIFEAVLNDEENFREILWSSNWKCDFCQETGKKFKGLCVKFQRAYCSEKTPGWVSPCASCRRGMPRNNWNNLVYLSRHHDIDSRDGSQRVSPSSSPDVCPMLGCPVSSVVTHLNLIFESLPTTTVLWHKTSVKQETTSRTVGSRKANMNCLYSVSKSKRTTA